MHKRTTVAELIGLLYDECPSGFATALHLSFATPTFLFQTYPASWLEEYTREGLHMVDPNVSWGFVNTGTIRWSDLARQDPSGVIDAARRHGMAYGFAWATSRGGTRSVAGLSRPDREYGDEEIEAISILLEQLHDMTADRKTLTPADRAALKEMSIRLTHN